MKNKLKFYLFFIGIFISFLSSFFVFQYSFSAQKVDVLEGLSKSTPITIQKNANVNDIVSNIIGTALSFVAIIFFIIIIYGGFLWMTASGNEDQAKKGLDIVIASVIGVVIILSSYTLVKFIFSTVESGQVTNKELVNSCKQYNPNWDCMDITKCAGKDGNGGLTDAKTQCEPDNTNNCIRNKCMADGLKDEVNTICCLPYVSPCTLENPGYKCVDNEDLCTSAVASGEGLCKESEFCCDSREVWTYSPTNTEWSDLEGSEGQIKKFSCISEMGYIDATSINFNNSVWFKQSGIFGIDFRKSDAGKYQFNSEAECQEYGETEKVFCLKYNKNLELGSGTKKGFYCVELLKGQSTKDCAFTSSRLFNSSGGSEDKEISCLEAQDSYNN